MSFDVVIPVGPNELPFIHNQIQFVVKNVIGYRNIYIITKSMTNIPPNCILIDESAFPFQLKDVADYFGENNRNGWYLQQLLKLYAGFVIDGILDTYLVIDADVYFLHKLHFVHGDDKFMFAVGTENHLPYFTHMTKLHPSFGKMTHHSGIVHHMVFHRPFVQELFELVETFHDGIPFWKAFIECVAKTDPSGASEYELYFHFMLKYHASNVVLRGLRWTNTHRLYNLSHPHPQYDYVSLCSYIKPPDVIQKNRSFKKLALN